MKIALQMSGQLRSFSQAHKFLKANLLDLVECDVFLSTWSKLPSQMYDDETDVCQINIDKFKSLYNVVAHRTDVLTEDFLQDYIDICYDGWLVPTKNVKVEYMVYGFYHKYMCNQLRLKYDVSYDAIMVVRPDLVMAEPFPIHLLPYAQDYLLIPAGSDWEYGTNDLLAVGNSDHITKYCDVFKHLKKYIKQNILVHPEHINKFNIDDLAIPVRRFGYTTHLRARRMT